MNKETLQKAFDAGKEFFRDPENANFEEWYLSLTPNEKGGHKAEQKQALIDMMGDDEKAGIYEEEIPVHDGIVEGYKKPIESQDKGEEEIIGQKILNKILALESRHSYRDSMKDNRFSRQVVPLLRQLYNDCKGLLSKPQEQSEAYKKLVTSIPPEIHQEVKETAQAYDQQHKVSEEEWNYLANSQYPAKEGKYLVMDNRGVEEVVIYGNSGAPGESDGFFNGALVESKNIIRWMPEK